MSVARGGLRTLARWYKNVVHLAILPGIIMHEMAHYAAARPWLNDADVYLWRADGTFHPGMRLDVDDEIPRYGQLLVAFAPGVVGAIMTPGVLEAVLTSNLSVALVILMNWVVLTFGFSGDDAEVARRAIYRRRGKGESGSRGENRDTGGRI
jgi:hypothetical protein